MTTTITFSRQNGYRSRQHLLTRALLSIEKISSSNWKISIDSVPTDKDVARTDRLNVFYSEANHSNVKKLYDVLLTYCMYNFDLGKLKKHVLSRNSPLSVILLQIVMVSPATHLMKNHESLAKSVYYSLLKLKYSPSIYLKHKKD